MTRPAYQPASLLLAAIYAFIALFGHGLHTHDECADDHGTSPDVAVCACGHDHACYSELFAAEPAASESGGPHYEQAISHHNCAACAVLAQLSVGYAAADPPHLQLRPSAPQRLSTVLVFGNPTERLADARGPPATRA